METDEGDTGRLSSTAKKNMIKMTEKVSTLVNYRFALDDARMADRERDI